MRKLLPDLPGHLYVCSTFIRLFLPGGYRKPHSFFNMTRLPVQVPDKKRLNIAKKLVSIHAGLTLCSVVCRLIR